MNSIPGSERPSGGGNGSPLQYPCLKNPMDRGAWRATVHGVTKCWTWLSMHTGRSVLRWCSLVAFRDSSVSIALGQFKLAAVVTVLEISGA